MKKWAPRVLLAAALAGLSAFLLKGDVWTFWTWWLLAFLMGMVAMPIILYFGHGDSASQSGWTGVMSVFGVIIFVFVLCAFAFTKERIPASTEKLTLKQSFQALKGNKAIFIMSGALIPSQIRATKKSPPTNAALTPATSV